MQLYCGRIPRFLLSFPVSFFHNFFPFIFPCKLKYSYRGYDNSYIFVELILTEIDIWVLSKKSTCSILFSICRRSCRRFNISSRLDVDKMLILYLVLYLILISLILIWCQIVYPLFYCKICFTVGFTYEYLSLFIPACIFSMTRAFRSQLSTLGVIYARNPIRDCGKVISLVSLHYRAANVIPYRYLDASRRLLIPVYLSTNCHYRARDTSVFHLSSSSCNSPRG